MFFIINQSLFSSLNLRLSDNLYGGAPQVDSIVLIGIDDKSLQTIGRWPWNRTNFAKIIPILTNASVIGIDVGFYEESNNFSDQLFSKAIGEKSNLVIASQYGKFEILDNNIFGTEVLKPISVLKNAKTAYVNIPLDSDGVSRSINFNIQGKLKSFSELIASEFTKKNIDKTDSSYLINFVGKPNSFPIYSFSDVLSKNISAKIFKNKIVLIGATSPDLRDTFLVPTSKGKLMPGIEVHANTINTLLLEQELNRQSNLSIYFLVILTCFLTLLLLNYLKLSYSTVLIFFLIFLYLFLAIIFFEKGLIINLVYVPITLLLTYITFTSSSYLDEQKAKQKIQSAFGKYLSPVVIEELIANPSKLKLGGENRNITVFFSDIEGFTTISEKLSAHKLTTLLNEYLDEMTKIILENGGLVDKFIGDAVMAFWGAPLSQNNQTILAAKTAIEQQEKLNELRPLWKKRFGIDLNIRIGLSYGRALVGNMGSSQRFDYTCIGDIVNLSSRLEAINKSYGTKIMVSDLVYNRIKNKFILREIDSVRVKGKKKSTKIFELICDKNNFNLDQKKLIDEYNIAMKLYRNQKILEAIKIFENLKKTYNDKASKVFHERCLELKHKKLKKDWDGVFTMTSK